MLHFAIPDKEDIIDVLFDDIVVCLSDRTVWCLYVPVNGSREGSISGIQRKLLFFRPVKIVHYSCPTGNEIMHVCFLVNCDLHY